MAEKPLEADYDFEAGTYANGTGNYVLKNRTTGRERVYENGVLVGDVPNTSEVGVQVNDAIFNYKTTGQKVMFIFAHPDDEQYMAGTIQQMLANGQDVYVAYTTSGQNGTDVTGTHLTGSIGLRDAREAEAVASLTGLGVTLTKIYALRQDADSLNIDAIANLIGSTLITDGVVLDCIFTFDKVGVYGNNEHGVCQRIGLELFRQTATTKAIYYFTIPESDINEAAGTDITDVGGGSNASDDRLVDFIYTLSTAQNTAKKGILDIHVTQYEDPLKSQIQGHYDSRPYEYICVGNAKVNGSGQDPLHYLYSLYRV